MDDHESSETPENSAQGGFLDSLRTLLSTLVGIAHTRVELISTEVEEQFARLVSLLVWGLVAMFLAFSAVILSAIAFIVLFWDSSRVLAAAGLAAAFVLLAAIAVSGFIARMRSRPRLFNASLDELARDRSRLDSR